MPLMKKFHIFTVFSLWLSVFTAAFLITVYLAADLNSNFAQGDLPTPTPIVKKDPEKVIFVSNKSGNQEIYSMNLATKEIVNLTNHTANDMNPQSSPDGKSLVFYSDRDGDNEIYHLDLATLRTKQLTQNRFQDYDPEFSPDGTFIAYKSNSDDNKGDIFIIPTDLSKPAVNLTPTLPTTEEWDPTFTKDGKKLVFVSRTKETHDSDELFTVSIDGSNLTQLTDNIIPDWYPSTLPNGQIIFISKADPFSGDHIFSSNIDGTRRQILVDQEGNNDDPHINPNANKIIFINDKSEAYNIYTSNIDGSNIELLLDTPENELSPIFLPQTE
jgi:TolB protein